MNRKARLTRAEDRIGFAKPLYRKFDEGDREITTFEKGELTVEIDIVQGETTIVYTADKDVPNWGMIPGEEVDVSLPLGPTLEVEYL